MLVAGTVAGKDQDFTVEIDTGDLWQEIESSVEDCASEAVTTYMDYYEHDVDFTEGASNLLGEYNPGNGCSLAREFEAAVQGAVQVDNWLVDLIGREVTTYNQSHTPLLNAEAAEIRKLVRSEVRMALAAALTPLPNGEDSEEL